MVTLTLSKSIKTILLGVNLVMALLLAFTNLSALIAPSASTFLALFGLVYHLLLLVNLAFALLWLVFRNKFVLISLVVILLGYNNILNNFHFNPGTGKTIQREALKVLTYNVKLFGTTGNGFGEESTKRNIIEFIQKEDPHITCLQEYYSEGITPYEPLQSIKETLNLSTYYFESYFSPKHNQLTGMVIFSKFPATDKGKLKFNGSRTFGIYTDLLVGADTIRVYNIHLASIQLEPGDIDFVVSGGKDEEAFSSHALLIYSKLSEAFLLREHQINTIADHIKSCPFPVLLAGDFNDTPSSYVYRKISRVLKDSFKEKGSGIGVTFAGQLPFLRIDYVFTGKEFTTIKYERHRIRHSDHYPISATLSIEK